MKETQVPEPTPNPPPARRRRRGELPTWVTVVTLAAVLAGAAGLVYAAFRPEGGIWVDDLRADAEQRLPPGSSREQAREWFASHGITDVTEVRDMVGSGYRAVIPNGTWMEDADIVVTCMFDRQDKLDRLTVIRMTVNRAGGSGPPAAGPAPDGKMKGRGMMMPPGPPGGDQKPEGDRDKERD
jgi:hypothetical protein